MRYETPATTREAAALLEKETGAAFVLAGGTDLLVRMKLGHIEPALLVDIKRIPIMSSITHSAKGTRIGAAVSGAELGEHNAIAKAWPGVVEATNLIGSDQVQSRCTMVGYLCNASPAADSVPAMIAAGAKAVVVSRTGRRTVPVEKIVTVPGQTSLARGGGNRSHPSASALRQIGGCLSALYPENGNGYRRGQCRDQSHSGARPGQDRKGGTWCSGPDGCSRASCGKSHNRKQVG